MKYKIFVVLMMVSIITSLYLIAFANDKSQQSPLDSSEKQGKLENNSEYPIAAGIWYPQDGQIPEKPMRYYRVRCWPGCHIGSKYGMFPDIKMENDKPIWNTSTMDSR